MSAQKRFRVSRRYQEIASIIEQSKSSDTVFVWKSAGAHRQTYPVKISKVEGRENRIEFHLKTDNADFKPGETVYLKMEARDSAFKTEVLGRKGKSLILAFPEEMVLHESRSDPRHYFHPSEDKLIQIKSAKVQAFKLKPFNALVCDISESGAAMYIPSRLGSSYEIHDQIKIDTLGPTRLKEELVGEILFKMPYEIKGILGKEKGFKVGIQFQGRIPAEVLQKFLERRNVFSLQEEHLVRTTEFRRKVHEGMAQLQTRLQGRKKVRDFFKALDVPRAENQYLKQHIYLLSEVMCGLGTRLGWVSEASIDKLIYVAFLHDIRFIDCPHIARIQTKAEFEKRKDSLTEEERRAFLEAPAFAAEIARQDSEAYPDAIKILSQQKELPEGTGFPQGLTASFLPPLTCLFIVCHFFVDYVIQHPDWDTDDFVKTYQKKLKGQYCQKILNAMRA